MEAQAGQAPSLLGALLPFVVLMLLFYFMIIRPQKKQQQQRDAMIAGLRKGNRITTIGGIYGEIVDIKDDAVLLNVASQGERLIVRVAKWGVQDVLGKDNVAKDKETEEEIS
ncbi:MAG: preprotein translocase subunit YajC [Bacillota bacterium]|jgi:preprotein translocase subunit YajC|nr:preprotein translocase subunit YajC [Bacillota bacterium]HOB42032.1 preprotein translocase subunit YajC [Bacillota bacterium]HOO29645.1 preprotein translocase subunit YajC [Bacillota bacterium]HPZ12756.1 preprotein translocase subunit YajC [Bacillota bacterium]HQD79814.1 preprotein translocase subunit YajC [Bacillota bacterium]